MFSRPFRSGSIKVPRPCVCAAKRPNIPRNPEIEDGNDALLTKTLPKVATEMALSVLAYNFTRVINILGAKPLMAALAA